MGRKKIPGIYKRKDIWHIDKQVGGIRISESTGTTSLEEAEKYLAHKIEYLRNAAIYGIRPKRTFSEAAAKYIEFKYHKKSLKDDILLLKVLDRFIGQLPLESIHIGTLQPYINARKEDGVKTRTINHGLKVVRHILNLAASEWMDAFGLTWLAVAPKIKMLPENDLRKPYPLSWDEQEKLFSCLPLHLKRMALFAVNTGCRDREICRLKWKWEVKLSTIGSAFVVPGQYTKNGEDRLIVLNKAAQEVINEVRSINSEYVFTYNDKPIQRMLNNGWKTARQKAGMPFIRVHDLKHTFGRRLRAAGVSFEDRQDLLGHKSERITTHYSAAELANLIKAADKACESKNGTPVIIIKHLNETAPAKVPQEEKKSQNQKC